MLLYQVTMVSLVFLPVPLMPVLGVPVVVPLVLLMIVVIGPHDYRVSKHTPSKQALKKRFILL
jgi:hypothetical protein